ncbi:MAG: nucleoside-diphosphate kinase [Candidatus Riesia sp.]|nr:nucleoside-diphosphate kinase [Candidatus Riesia sp.]
MNNEYNTLLMIKPDAIRNKVAGDIISMLEKNFYIKDIFFIKFNRSLAEEFYIEHLHKNFYKELVDFIISSKVLVLIIQGNENVVTELREFVGHTDFKQANPKSIRGSFATSLTENAVHASDSFESFTRELSVISKGLL